MEGVRVFRALFFLGAPESPNALFKTAETADFLSFFMFTFSRIFNGQNMPRMPLPSGL